MNIINLEVFYSKSLLDGVMKKSINYPVSYLRIAAIALTILGLVKLVKRVNFGLLHLSVTCMPLNITKFFIRFLGLDVNRKNRYGWVPLHLATGFENLGAAKLLIEQGADVKKKAKDGWTPLRQAINQRNRHFIKLFTDHGANINEKDENGNTPLIEAISKHDLALAEVLIKYGADVNKTNKQGNTPLIEAISNHKISLVEVLIKYGADVNKTNKQGNTPLIEAISKGSLDLVEFLIKRKADVNKEDGDGNTPLIHAVHKKVETLHSKYMYMISCFINHGVNINKTNKEGRTPLLEVVRGGREIVSILGLPEANSDFQFRIIKRLIKYFIRHGGDVDKEDNNGETPLSEVVKTDDKKLIQLFLRVKSLSSEF